MAFHRPIMLIALAAGLSACQTTGSTAGSTTGSTSYKWPSFQAGLKPGPSTSPVKAKLSSVSLTPAAEKTAPERAAFGGVWEGWMCRDRVVDAKIAVREVSNAGATVDYATGAQSFGNANFTVATRFAGDVLKGTFPNGAGLILGMRSDGHMNIRYDAQNWCTGILRQVKSLPKS